MIKISHSVTRDSPDGQPWPPSDSSVLWVIVRRAEGCTLWRAIRLAQERASGDSSIKKYPRFSAGDRQAL
jgi:hypothetical protein